MRRCILDLGSPMRLQRIDFRNRRSGRKAIVQAQNRGTRLALDGRSFQFSNAAHSISSKGTAVESPDLPLLM